VKVFFNENYKIHIVKMATQSTNSISIKIPMSFFTEIEKAILKLEPQNVLNSQRNFEQTE
jgi:hypothetical protein